MMPKGGRNRAPSQRGRGKYPYRGRGQGEFQNPVVIQHGNKTLVNLSSTSGNDHINSSSDTDASLFKEFLAFKNSQNKSQGSTEPSSSYATITAEHEADDNLEVPYVINNHKEIILFLEPNDISHVNFKTQEPGNPESYRYLERYLHSMFFPTGSYKQRTFYETILRVTGSCDIVHYYPAIHNHRTIFNFSKVVIKQILSVHDWGISTLQEKEFTNKESDLTVKFTYWDYVQAFHQAFLYENSYHKHTWFFKVCPQLYNNALTTIPTWFYNWWHSFGPSIKILPPAWHNLYTDWVSTNPILIEAKHSEMMYEGMPSAHFFIEFGIPWIWRWTPLIGQNSYGMPCLWRVYQTKFWKKLLRPDHTGIIEGQTTFDEIKIKIDSYRELLASKHQREAPNPFKHLNIQLKDTQLSQEEIIETYMAEVKKNLLDNYGITVTHTPSVTMMSEDGNTVGEEDAQPVEDVEILSSDEVNRIEQEFHQMEQMVQQEAVIFSCPCKKARFHNQTLFMTAIQEYDRVDRDGKCLICDQIVQPIQKGKVIADNLSNK